MRLIVKIKDNQFLQYHKIQVQARAFPTYLVKVILGKLIKVV